MINKKKISICIAIVMTITYIFGGIAVPSSYADEVKTPIYKSNFSGVDISNSISNEKRIEYLNQEINESKNLKKDEPDKDDDVWVIIESNDKPLIKYSQENNSKISINNFIKSEEGRSISNTLKKSQENIKNQMKKENIGVEFKQSYTTVLNGFAAKVKYGDINKIKKIPNVKRVTISATYNKVSGEKSQEAEKKLYEQALIKEGVQYNGAGIKIAIIDSGLDWKHSAFQKNPYKIGATKEDISNALGDTFAKSQAQEINVKDIYCSEKVPFAFDYADADTDVIPSENAIENYGNDHGTHVAGIAAGNDNQITGTAPEAQIYAMKVFSDNGGGAETVDVLGALNDSVLLGADVVNMSLGSSGGFSSEQSDSLISQIYNVVYNSGIDVVCSAGNEYSAGYGGVNGDLLSSSNPDTGIIGADSSYKECLSVASINSTNSMYMTVADKKVRYSDISGHSFVDDLGDKTFEYVMVPGTGDKSDYEGLDVKDKIAVVMRGDLSFEDKQLNAAENGAKACIIYNNKSGYVIDMSIDNVKIPTASISYDDGIMMANQENKNLTLLEKEGNKLMSEFSSWGPLPSLELKPEITAPGGQIYSSLPYQKYGYMNGTSMSSPWIAGATASVEQYVKNKYPNLSKKEQGILSYRLLMSTSVIAEDENGNAYSPRKQGAGVASISNAVTTDAYLYVNGQDKTKLELGDDKNQSGIYDMTFHVKNMENKKVSYDLSTIVLTETVNGNSRIAQKSKVLDDAKTDILSVKNAAQDGNMITIAENQDAEISLRITLSDTDKQYMKNTFENGIYVEGFVKLSGKDESVIDLSIPYLAFFGDWTKAPLLDEDIYSDKSPEMIASTPVGNMGFFYSFPLGTYLFKTKDGQEDPKTDSKKNAVGLGQGNGISSIGYTNLGLLRGAKSVTSELRDTATGKLYSSYVDYNVRRARYITSYGKVIPSIVGDLYPQGIFGIANERSNTEMTYTISADLDYDDPQSNVKSEWSFPIYVDYEYPIIDNSESLTSYEKDGRTYLEVDFRDNHYMMAAGIYDVDMQYDYMGDAQEVPGDCLDEALTPIYDSTPGYSTKVTFDITDYKEKMIGQKFYILSWDYALNQSTYMFETKAVDPTGISLDKTEATMKINDILNLVAKIEPENATNKDIEWSSSDENVAVVKDGTVLATGKGTADITVKTVTGGFKSTCKVTVEDIKGSAIPVDKITTDVTDATVEQGKSIMITASTEPWYATDKTLKWTSADESIAIVNNGEVTGIKPGNVVIIVESVNGVKAECNITVSEKLSDFNIKDGVLLGYGGDSDSIVVPDGVVEIGNGAFADNKKIVSVTLPESVDKIGDRAFQDCTQLKEVKMPKSMSYIGEDVFSWATSLESLVIPEGIERLEEYTFSQCKSLKNISLPSTLKVLGDNCFSGCKSIKEIILPENFEEFESSSIGAYTFDSCISLEKVNMPKKITELPDKVFMRCNSLSSIDLSNIKYIGKYAFTECGFTNIDIPENVTTIDYYAFSKCDNLKEINILGEAQLGEKVFYGNKALEKFTAPKIQEISKYAFSGCTALKKFIIPENVIKINDNAFYNCISLEEVIIPKEAKYTGIGEQCGEDIFDNCKKFKKYVVEEGNEYLTSDDSGMLYTSDSKTLVSIPFAIDLGDVLTIPEGVEIINDYVFQGREFKEIKFPNSLKNIGKYAFYNSYSGETLSLPKGLESIGDYAFYGCDALKDINFGDSLVSIGDYAFYYYGGLDVTELIFPSTLKSIGSYAFYSSSKLKSIDFGKGIESIGDSAFYRCKSLLNIDGEENLKTIGNKSFYQCEKLKEFTFGSNLTSIGDYAFENCHMLDSIELPDTVTSIGKYSFAYLSSLKSLKLSEGLKEIPDNAFYRMNEDYEDYGCTSPMKDINIPASIEVISDSAFSNCDYIEKFIVDDNNLNYSSTEDGGLVDKNSGVLFLWPSGNTTENIIISEGVTTLDDYIFYGNDYVKKITLPSTIEHIGKSAVASTNISEVNFTELKGGLTIDGNAFSNNKNLYELNFPKGTISLGDYCLRDCSALISVIMPDTVESIGIGQFQRDYALQNLKLSSMISEIPSFSFEECSSIEEIQIPQQVSSIVFDSLSTPFDGCTSLKSITVQEGNKNYKSIEGVLYDISGKEIECYPVMKEGEHYDIPEGVVRLQNRAFHNNLNLKSVVLPSTLQRVGDCAFKGCLNLKEYDFRSENAPLLEVGLYFPNLHISNYGNFYDYYVNLDDDLNYVYTDYNLSIKYPEGAKGYDKYEWNLFFKDKTETGLEDVFAVNNLNAVVNQGPNCELSWNVAPWAEEYKIERAEKVAIFMNAQDSNTGKDVVVNDEVVGEFINLGKTSSTSYVDKNIQLGKTYEYRVTPLKDSGNSEGVTGSIALFINATTDVESNALAVISMIEKISNPVTIEDKSIIETSRKLYDDLSEEGKKLVYNYEKLVEAEKSLKELQEIEDKKKADLEAANNVIELINKIPSVITIEDQSSIEEARKSYDLLTDDQKKLVTNYDLLVKAEKDLSDIKDKIEQDKEAAGKVIDLIDKIPEEVTLKAVDIIKSARDGYDSLTEEQKVLVSNYSRLLDAENIIKEIMIKEEEDKKAVDNVINLIEDIQLPITLESEGEIDVARKAYDSLTDEQKNLVVNYDDLVKAEKTLNELREANKPSDNNDNDGNQQIQPSDQDSNDNNSNSSTNGSGNKPTFIVKTGSVIGNLFILLLGIISISAGVFIFTKTRRKKEVE